MMRKIRRVLRALVPGPWRLRVRICQRAFLDKVTGLGAEQRTTPAHPSALRRFHTRAAVTQPIRPGAYRENKIHNLRLAAGAIGGRILEPGHVFSYWQLVGPPSEARGYRRGRTLQNDEMIPDVGGGLCQLSGLVYHLALLLDLEIVERHSHSHDIYTEEERFTPLGADAAVVFGYRDLRFRNVCGCPLLLRFSISTGRITGRLCSPGHRPLQRLAFSRETAPGGKIRVTAMAVDSTPPRRLAVSLYAPYTGPTVP